MLNSSVAQVINSQRWAKMKDMSPGIGISLFQGLTRLIDFARRTEQFFCQGTRFVNHAPLPVINFC